MVYLDATGAARPRASAVDALHRASLSLWADPLRQHADGQRSAQALQSAREVIATAVGARPSEVTFTPSHTQAVHLAIRAMVSARRRRHGDRIVASRAERTSLLHAARYNGILDTVEVDHYGQVDPEAYATALRQGPAALAIIHHANVEVGTLQPVQQIYATAMQEGIPLLVDASSSLGHISVGPEWDALALDAREWGAPVGVGVVVARTRVRLRPDWPEDAHAWFPGGVSVPAAFAAAVALEEALTQQAEESSRLRALTAVLRDGVQHLAGIRPVGDPLNRLPHTVSFAIDQADGEVVAAELDRRGISVGTGSSCTSSTIEPNHVLAAMGVQFDGHLRASLDHASTAADVTDFLAQLPLALTAVAQHH